MNDHHSGGGIKTGRYAPDLKTNTRSILRNPIPVIFTEFPRSENASYYVT